VEGQWLHPGPGAPVENGAGRPLMPGAAIPIIYAIPLLEQKHIVWRTAGP
jgi:hypothetical protein